MQPIKTEETWQTHTHSQTTSTLQHSCNRYGRIQSIPNLSLHNSLNLGTNFWRCWCIVVGCHTAWQCAIMTLCEHCQMLLWNQWSSETNTEYTFTVTLQLHYITLLLFSAGPTTTRTGPAIQVSTIILRTKTMNVKSRYVNVKKSESSAVFNTSLRRTKTKPND